mgnify:CR=1 FL=1
MVSLHSYPKMAHFVQPPFPGWFFLSFESLSNIQAATKSFFARVMNRITLTGALFLAFVSILPMVFAVVADLPRSVSIGGTSLLIVVGVALETMKQVESQLIKRHYKGFINK